MSGMLQPGVSRGEQTQRQYLRVLLFFCQVLFAAHTLRHVFMYVYMYVYFYVFCYVFFFVICLILLAAHTSRLCVFCKNGQPGVSHGEYTLVAGDWVLVPLITPRARAHTHTG